MKNREKIQITDIRNEKGGTIKNHAGIKKAMSQLFR